jgi:hypothetical protein
MADVEPGEFTTLQGGLRPEGRDGQDREEKAGKAVLFRTLEALAGDAVPFELRKAVQSSRTKNVPCIAEFGTGPTQRRPDRK